MHCRAQNKNKIVKSKYVRIALLISLGVVVFIYVSQISMVSTQGYYLKDLERQVQKLEKNNEQLGFETAKLRSLSRIETVVSELGMVLNDKIDYLQTGQDAVAFKQ